MSKYPNFSTPYEAGYDAGENGANTKNAHFGYFLNPTTRDDWMRGKQEAIKDSKGGQS